MKRILTKEEVYGCSVMAENLIDDKFVYYDDLTCLEIHETRIQFYKLVNPFSIDIPIYKMKKVRHREDGPAVETMENGETTHEWYIDGKYHREDGPAYEKTDKGGGEQKSWYKNGKRHRTDGPAVITPKNSTEYWVDGELHRTDGPAVEDKSRKIEAWYVNGVAHRTDGPAKIDGDLYDYCVNGKYHRTDGPARYYKTYHSGETIIEYRVDGELHRTDGPAYIKKCGDRILSESYYINGLLHREGGYAEYNYNDSYSVYRTYSYRKNGLLHRTDGPAYIDTHKTTGERKYFVDGVEYKFCNFWLNKLLKKF